MSIQALREERTKIAGQIRQITDENKETWTDDLTTQVDALYEQVDKIDAQIERETRALDLEARLEVDRNDPDNPAPATPPAANERPEVQALVFDAFLRGGEARVDRLGETVLNEYRQSIRAEQSTGTDTEGGHLVPRDFSGVLLERLKEYGGVREVADVMQTDSGNPIDWPTIDETGEEGELVGENQDASDGDMTFGTKSMGAFKFSSKVITIPFELMQDSRIGNLEAMINGKLQTRLGRVTNRFFTTGTGVGQPEGMVVGASEGKVGAAGQVASVSYNDLVDMEHAVDPAYRRNGPRWMFHDATLKALKKLKDNDGRPLWRPGLTGGDPADIMNYGYTINQDMAEMAANARSMLFGDFKKYVVRDVMAVTLFRFSDSAYTKKGQIGFMAWMRADGRSIDASDDAIKYYQNAAA